MRIATVFFSLLCCYHVRHGKSCRRPLQLVSVKFVSAILGLEMGAPNFMGHLEKCVRSAGKTLSIKFRVLGGGGILGLGGGGSADFIFMGARIFLKKALATFHDFVFKQPLESPSTEDPSTQESQPDHGTR